MDDPFLHVLVFIDAPQQQMKPQAIKKPAIAAAVARSEARRTIGAHRAGPRRGEGGNGTERLGAHCRQRPDQCAGSLRRAASPLANSAWVPEDAGPPTHSATCCTNRLVQVRRRTAGRQLSYLCFLRSTCLRSMLCANPCSCTHIQARLSTQRQANRACPKLRCPGRHRHREHASAQRAAPADGRSVGGSGAANGDLRGASGHLKLAWGAGASLSGNAAKFSPHLSGQIWPNVPLRE
jgi:hypothetical protein